MKQRLFWTLLFFILLGETYYLLPSNEPVNQILRGPSFLSGIVHVHSVFSDGGGTVPEIAEAAQKAGVDFVVLTDHNTSGARAAQFEKRYGKVDMFVEMEASTHVGHCLTFYSHSEAKQLNDDAINKLSWKHFLGEETKEGMFIVVAHPSNIKNPWNRFDHFPDGLEIINFDSVWQRQVSEAPFDFFLTSILLPFNQYLSSLRFFQIYQKDLDSWDSMNALSPGHFGILAQDTHSKLKLNPQISFGWPDYYETFKLGSNIVFLDKIPEDFEMRKAAIYQSIRLGKSAMVFSRIRPFAGNDWSLSCKGEPPYRSGDRLSFKNQCQFQIRMPTQFPFRKVVRLIKDGVLAKEISTVEDQLAIPVEAPGVYRLEIWAQVHSPLRLLANRAVPYLLYNPIYFK